MVPRLTDRPALRRMLCVSLRGMKSEGVLEFTRERQHKNRSAFVKALSRHPVSIKSNKQMFPKEAY